MNNKIVLDNEKLIYVVLKKLHLYHMKDEYIDIGYIGLVKGINTFNPNYGVKLSTYLAKCITNEILIEQRKNKNKKKIPDSKLCCIDEIYLLDEKINIEADFLKEEQKKFLYEAISKLSYNEQFIIKHAFGLCNFEKMKNKDMALMLNLSENTITKIKYNGISKLKKYLNSVYD